MYRIAVPKFPGASGAEDVVYAYSSVIGDVEAYTVAPEAERLGKPDAVIIPGGYSFGDYLRPGGLAKTCRVSGAIKKFARDGGPILGVGNGFQILCELDLLPGALIINYSTSFMNEQAYIKVASNLCPFTKHLAEEKVLRMPISCYYGAFFADPRTLRELEQDDHIAFRYCNHLGDTDDPIGFNGSLNSIAGIISRHGNVMGMMPHPERAVEAVRGGTDGLAVLSSVLIPDSNPESAQSADGPSEST
ncbi:MAG: phosphoribosylformylglycinamidine synthase I [Bdellovibrionales bacterium]|nr:phosphoribosylformylglycinamidine synthase I [Bdellovibrionales bacterium]